MKLAIVGRSYKYDRNMLEKVAKAAFSFLGEKEGFVELKFVSEKEISDLNQTYRNKAGATDVLTFSVSDKPLIGQVFICYNIAKKQAKVLKKTLNEEICLLLLHGILHLYGYDHKTLEEAGIMEDIETRILSKLELKR